MAPLLPKTPMAILDGWALAADSTLGAGGYSPVLLAAMPQRVEAGQPMPPGADCVAAFDAVKVTGGRAEALDTVNPGDGVLPAGADCDGKSPLRRAGEALRSLDGAVFAAAGISHVSVRDPRIMVLPLREGDAIDAAAGLVGGDIESHGGAGHRADCGGKLAAALATDNVTPSSPSAAPAKGATIRVCRRFADKGRLVVHGMALSPGETAAFGFAGPRPVLLLPGRLDAALSVWLVAGRRMLARLAGGRDHEPGTTATLARKVTSTVGLAEVVAVRRSGDSVEPLASEISAAVVAGGFRRMDIGAGRQRRLSRRFAGFGKAVAMSEQRRAKPDADADLLARVRAAARQEQFLEVVSADEARVRFERHLDLSPLPAETVPLAAALTRVLAHDVVAAVDAPPFDRSNVDGFALRAIDTIGAGDAAPKIFRLNAEVIACGDAPALEVEPGTATTIATGGVIPRGADAVVMIEQTELIGGRLGKHRAAPRRRARAIHFLRRLRHRARRDAAAARHAHRLARDRHAGGLRAWQAWTWCGGRKWRCCRPATNSLRRARRLSRRASTTATAPSSRRP